MGYRVEMECTQTEVGDHSEIGYRSGDRLPVGHADVGPDWRPVVVEVEDKPVPAPVPVPEEKPATSTPSPAKHTGVRQG